MARYFALTMPGPEEGILTIWCVDGADAYRVGVPSPKQVVGAHFSVSARHTPQEAFASHFNWVNTQVALRELTLAPGHYYARMVRPTDLGPLNRPGTSPGAARFVGEVAQAIGQLCSLVGRLSSICQVVEPDAANLKTFGHEIRECLVIAAMEVESSWKAILRANGSLGLTTNDYVKLLPAMRLDQYEIAFNRYPKLNRVRPFAGWDPASPTKSLGFYSAYHSVKHDRESNFADGTLEHAFVAVAACAVLAAAQFGWIDVFVRSADLKEFFSLAAAPQWETSDFYTYAYDGWPATQVDYAF